MPSPLRMSPEPQSGVRAKGCAEDHRFDWADPLGFEALLGDEKRQVQAMARRFAQDVLQRKIVSAFREECADRNFYRELGGLGLLAPTLPVEFGGGGASYVTYDLVARELELSLETVSTYEATYDIHGLILGRAQTGISAFA